MSLHACAKNNVTSHRVEHKYMMLCYLWAWHGAKIRELYWLYKGNVFDYSSIEIPNPPPPSLAPSDPPSLHSTTSDMVLGTQDLSSSGVSSFQGELGYDLFPFDPLRGALNDIQRTESEKAAKH